MHHSQFRLRFYGRGEYAKLEVQRQAYDVKRPITESSRKRGEVFILSELMRYNWNGDHLISFLTLVEIEFHPKVEYLRVLQIFEFKAREILSVLFQAWQRKGW